MPDPLTLAAVGAVVLNEGVKFLYQQAGEVLKWWRQRKDAEGADAKDEAVVASEVPEAIEAPATALTIHYNALEQVQQELTRLYGELALYGNGVQEVDPGNARLLGQVDVLRRLMEAVYQQRLTFAGEQRPAEGPVGTGRIDVDVVLGYAAAIDADTVHSGTLTADARYGTIAEGATGVAMRVKQFGTPVPRDPHPVLGKSEGGEA
jgi:hypothetical protein